MNHLSNEGDRKAALSGAPSEPFSATSRLNFWVTYLFGPEQQNQGPRDSTAGAEDSITRVWETKHYTAVETAQPQAAKALLQ